MADTPTPSAPTDSTPTDTPAEVKTPMAFKYVGDGSFYFGIPPTDLTVAQFETLPVEHQMLVQEVPEYRLWPGYVSPQKAATDGGN